MPSTLAHSASLQVGAVFLVLAIALLSPIASNTVLPSAPDHANHTAFVVEAKTALDEGQLPLRVAPHAADGLRYPLFQFYSQLPYLLAGGLYAFVPPHNPWVALKVVYLMGLWSAGLLVYGTCRLLGADRTIAILTGVAYVTSPYLLVNIHARGAYTEVVAQCLVPLVVYASTRLALYGRGLDAVFACMAWALLGNSHLITFIFTTGFFALFVASLASFRLMPRQSAVVLLGSCAFGWGLTAFQWLPAVVTTPLRFSLKNVFETNWLTPLPALFSLSGTPPEPTGGWNTPFLSPAIGLPVLVAAGGLLYLAQRGAGRPRASWLVLAFFGVTVFAVWSPIDFWRWLPRQVNVLQFSYRLLTYVMVFGSMLVALFLAASRRVGQPIALLPGLVILLIAAGPYLPTMPRNERSLGEIITDPTTSYASDAYIYAGDVETEVPFGAQLPMLWPDGWLEMDRSMSVSRSHFERAHDARLVMVGDAIDPRLGAASCRTLQLIVDEVVVAVRDIAPGPFEWEVPSGVVLAAIKGHVGSLAFHSACGFAPREVDPRSTDSRLLWLRIRDLRFVSELDRVLPLAAVRPSCRLAGADLTCDIDLAAPSDAFLPALYYPRLLWVTVNNRVVDYSAADEGGTPVVRLPLGAGRSHVVVRFTGLPMANWTSCASFVLMMAWGMWRRRRPAPAARVHASLLA